MSEQVVETFEDDIDVRVHKNVLMDVLELAEIYGFAYRPLQATWNIFNVCITYDAKHEKQIFEFIEDVNTIKSTIIFND